MANSGVNNIAHYGLSNNPIIHHINFFITLCENDLGQ